MTRLVMDAEGRIPAGVAALSDDLLLIVSAALTGTADLLRGDGAWGRHTLFRGPDGKATTADAACTFCLRGAICHAVRTAGLQQPGQPLISHLVGDVLAEHILLLGLGLDDVAAEDGVPSPADGAPLRLAAWNDAPARTLEEVLFACESAAAFCQALHEQRATGS